MRPAGPLDAEVVAILGSEDEEVPLLRCPHLAWYSVGRSTAGTYMGFLGLRSCSCLNAPRIWIGEEEVVEGEVGERPVGVALGEVTCELLKKL
jgi:hypothetical protein